MAAKLAKLGAVAALLLVCMAGAAADDYESLFRQAAEFSRLGKYGEAIERYKAALALRPGSPEALSNLAVMYYAGAKYKEAWDTAQQALRAQPGMTPAALIAGLSAIRCDRPADAVTPLEQVLRADPSNRDALLGLASARVATGKLDQAAALSGGSSPASYSGRAIGWRLP
jgi:tetratricopeptide (TPR) repeat protein